MKFPGFSPTLTCTSNVHYILTKLVCYILFIDLSLLIWVVHTSNNEFHKYPHVERFIPWFKELVTYIFFSSILYIKTYLLDLFHSNTYCTLLSKLLKLSLSNLRDSYVSLFFTPIGVLLRILPLSYLKRSYTLFLLVYLVYYTNLDGHTLPPQSTPSKFVFPSFQSLLPHISLSNLYSSGLYHYAFPWKKNTMIGNDFKVFDGGVIVLFDRENRKNHKPSVVQILVNSFSIIYLKTMDFF